MHGFPSQWWGRTSAMLMAAALLLAVPAPALARAGAPPGPKVDYEDDALETCPEGDLPCVRRTLDTLRQHTRDLVRSCDHDAAFALLYTIVTRFYYETVFADPDFFGDPAFVNREDAAFAHYYLYPHENARAGLRDGVPPAWRVAFEAAEEEDVSAAGNLLLGINAHVVRDLPFVLAELGLGSKGDHNRVNRILRAAYAPAIQAVNDRLDDSVDDANVDGVRLDDEALFRIVTSWREQAWQDAQVLSSALTPVDRAVVARSIEQKALRQAQALRAEFAYPPGSDDRSQRNAYCGAQTGDPGALDLR